VLDPIKWRLMFKILFLETRLLQLVRLYIYSAYHLLFTLKTAPGKIKFRTTEVVTCNRLCPQVTNTIMRDEKNTSQNYATDWKANFSEDIWEKRIQHKNSNANYCGIQRVCHIYHHHQGRKLLHLRLRRKSAVVHWMSSSSKLYIVRSR